MNMIRKLCYTLYKVDWRRNHVTDEMEAQSVKDYYNVKDSSRADYTYEDYLDEFGYCGTMMYASYNEFIHNEYLQKKYINTLLMDDEELVAMYREDVETLLCKNMYERIKQMSMSEMKQFVYWVYRCGNKDGRDECECSPNGYFGGYVLTLPVTTLMPNDNINDIWDTFLEFYPSDADQERAMFNE